MARAILIFGIIVIAFCSVRAQSRLDSMRQLVHDAPSDEKRVDYLNDLTLELFNHSLNESLQVIDETLRLSKKINYRYGEGLAISYKGVYYWLIGEPQESLLAQQQAFDIGRQIGSYGLMASAKIRNGKAFRDIGFYDSAMNNFRQAEAFQKLDPKQDLYTKSMIYEAIGKQFVLKELPDAGLPYLQQALRLREQIKDKALTAFILGSIADAYRVMSDYAKAREYYSKSIGIAPDNVWVQADYAEGMGLIAFAEGDFESALLNLSIVLKTYEEYKGKYTLAKVMIQVGEVLEEKGLYDLSNEYIFRALKIAEQAGYKHLEAEAHFELAWVAMRVNRLDDARASINRSQEIFSKLGNRLRLGGCYNVLGLILMKAKQYDSSWIAHKHSLQIRKSFNNKIAISSSLFNLGDLFLTWGRTEEALPYFEEGIKLDEELGDKYGISRYKNRFGRIYLEQGNFAEAERLFNESSAQLKKTTAYDFMRLSYRDYAELYEKKGDLKRSLDFRKQFERLNDSLYNRSSAQSMAAYRVLYELDIKNREIQLLNKDKIIQERELKQRSLILAIVIVVLVMLSLLAFVFFHNGRRMKRMNRDISERNEEIQTQSEELTESNQSLLRLNSEIERQREEIKAQAEELMVSNTSIAKINEGLEKMVEQRTTDLRTAYQELDTFFYRSSHDFRRPLTTLMGLAEVAKLSIKDTNALELFDKVNDTAANLDKMLVKLQSISDVGSHQLVFKEVLIKQLIENALEPFRDFLRERQAHVTIESSLRKPCISYPALIKIAIENVVENAVIFGDPFHPKIAIRVYHEAAAVCIEVEDNGEGIHPQAKPHIFDMFYRGSERSTGNGLGLYIAQKAIGKISGKISFMNNERRQGATFTIFIPD